MRARTILPFIFLLVAPLWAEDEEASESGALASPYVGMAARVESLMLPGSELVPAPLDEAGTPIVLRVLETYPHGDAGFRYDLEFYGLVHGTHDLSHYLVRVDGSPIAEGELPAIPVDIVPALPEGPPGLLNDLPDPETPRPGGYRIALVLIGLLWLAGLAFLILFRRPKEEEVEEEVAPPTLAEKLRPLVQRALDGDLDRGGQAQLERHLLGHWREKLDLRGLPAGEGIAKLREHREGGEILREVERWLHSRDGAGEVDVEALLEPYR